MKNFEKRDGRIMSFDATKIAIAMSKAFIASEELSTHTQTELMDRCMVLARKVEKELDRHFTDPVPIEDVQNVVEETLMKSDFPGTAKAYILYRNNRQSARERNSRLMQQYHELANADVKDSDQKRENANIDGNTPMGTMLLFGSIGAKEYYKNFILSPGAREGHESGDIHIHDLDFLSLTTTCSQIGLEKLFKGGFSTGHGYLREPNDIISYAALAAIAIQSNQNDQHGGQSVPDFDTAMAQGVKKTFRKAFLTHLKDIFDVVFGENINVEDALESVEIDVGEKLNMSLNEDPGDFFNLMADMFAETWGRGQETYWKYIGIAVNRALRDTEKKTYQAMEAFIHNLNTMHSRAGAQVPFSSINYGDDTTPEGRMVIRNILLATEAGLGRGETPHFPNQIFRIKRGINFAPSDPNYDLYKLAIRVMCKRMFPIFSFQDAPFNMEFYDPERPETKISYMGCRTRVMANVYDPENQIAHGRGNLSFTTINLPRLAIRAAIESGSDATRETWLEKFYTLLDEKMELVTHQLLERFQVQCTKKVKNYPFLMGQGVWLGSDKLGAEDSIAEILKHGTLSIGFIGLAECLKRLIGCHHGQSEEAQHLGLCIITKMRAFCDIKAEKHKLNFSLLATPAEGLSGRFVAIDKKLYGDIEGITDKNYYSNSFHIPVGFEVSAYDKIKLEAPYHALTNAGHITYVEIDGDIAKNPDVIETINRCMLESGIGYGGYNLRIDRDPICGYSGIIDEVCPKCGRREKHDGFLPIERKRRVTGYLGDYDRLNNAKRAEVNDRLTHLNSSH